MGYGKESRGPLYRGDSVWIAPITVTATGDKALARILEPCTVVRIGFLVTTALTVTALVADFDKRITPGSDTGRVDKGVGTITAPAAAQAIGKMIYKDITPVDLDVGDEVVFAVDTATTAGAGLPVMTCIPRAETPANQGDMVASS